jgi:hypothetical protein
VDGLNRFTNAHNRHISDAQHSAFDPSVTGGTAANRQIVVIFGLSSISACRRSVIVDGGEWLLLKSADLRP